ncbi:hypothetical protein D3C85_1563420 [compost metagenome]
MPAATQVPTEPDGLAAQLTFPSCTVGTRIYVSPSRPFTGVPDTPTAVAVILLSLGSTSTEPTLPFAAEMSAEMPFVPESQSTRAPSGAAIV